MRIEGQCDNKWLRGGCSLGNPRSRLDLGRSRHMRKPEGRCSRKREQEIRKPWGEMAGREWVRGGKGEQTGRFGPFWFFQAIRKESRFYSTYNGRLLESSLEGNDKIGSTLRRSTLTTRENKINSRDKSGNQKMSWETTGVDQVTGDSDWGGGGGGETGGSGWIWATVRTWRTVYKKMGERKRRTVDILPVFGLRWFFFLNNMYIKIIPGGNITKR